jgi:hypothetical protein
VGLAHYVDAVGLAHYVDAVGLAHYVDAVGLIRGVTEREPPGTLWVASRKGVVIGRVFFA